MGSNPVSDKELRRIIDITIEELGNHATKENVEAVVTEVLREYEKGVPSLMLSPEQPKPSEKPLDAGRIIVTAFGKNQPGIVSGITGVLAHHGCDLQDLSQKIMQDLFTLIMVVDISNATIDFTKLKTELVAAAEKIGVQIFVQHEDIIKAMHRV